MNYNKYFDLLNKYNKTEEYEISNNKKLCCNNQKTLIIDSKEICSNCGIVLDTELYENLDNNKFKNVVNPKFKLTTLIVGGGYKYKNIKRLQKWNNYDYKENTANNSYSEIKKIGKNIKDNQGHKLNIKLLDKACNIYNDIYMKKKISSRNKIKRAIFIYCIYKTCIDSNIIIDLLDLLLKNNISINNFNNAIIKLNDLNFSLNKNMFLFLDLTKKNYKIKINSYNIIKNYNYNLKSLKINNLKINKNTLLIYIFYKEIKPKNLKKFLKTFNITKITLFKLIKIIN